MSFPNTEPTIWHVSNKSDGRRRVHRSECRYNSGLPIYASLGFSTERKAAQIIIDAGAHPWHEGCRFCAVDFDKAMANPGWVNTERRDTP